jgi:hypothetical protein
VGSGTALGAVDRSLADGSRGFPLCEGGGGLRRGLRARARLGRTRRRRLEPRPAADAKAVTDRAQGVAGITPDFPRRRRGVVGGLARSSVGERSEARRVGRKVGLGAVRLQRERRRRGPRMARRALLERPLGSRKLRLLHARSRRGRNHALPRLEAMTTVSAKCELGCVVGAADLAANHHERGPSRRWSVKCSRDLVRESPQKRDSSDRISNWISSRT